MSSVGKTVAKNASVLMVSQLTTWVLTLVLTIVLGRYLGPENVGKLHLANSIWAMAGMFIGFGMDFYMVKEVARDHSRLPELFGTTIVTRFALYFVGFGIVALYASIANYPPITVYAIYIIGLANLVYQMGQSCRSALQGLERMSYISLGDVASKLFNSIVAITLLLLGYGVLVIAAVSIGTALVYTGVQFVALRRMMSVRLHFNPKMMVEMMRASFSYLLIRLSREMYIQVDVILISLIVSETVVGWYGQADKLFGTLLFVPSVFVTAVYPALSRLYKSSTESVTELVGKSFNFLLLISLPIGFGLLAVSTPLMVLLVGEEFRESGPVLAMFGVVLILTYQNMLIGQILISSDRQNILTTVTVIASLMTIPLDLVLIPWCNAQFGNGAIGGAIAFVITEAIILVVCLRYMPAGSLNRSNVVVAVKGLVAASLMGLVAWWMRDLFVLIPIAVGGIVYVGLVLLLRAIPQEDMIMLRGLMDTVLGQVKGRLGRA